VRSKKVCACSSGAKALREAVRVSCHKTVLSQKCRLRVVGDYVFLTISKNIPNRDPKTLNSHTLNSRCHFFLMRKEEEEEEALKRGRVAGKEERLVVVTSRTRTNRQNTHV